jgi:hypothetical protein
LHPRGAPRSCFADVRKRPLGSMFVVINLIETPSFIQFGGFSIAKTNFNVARVTTAHQQDG